MALYDNDTFEVQGLTFRFNTEADTDTGAPWEEYDGHGPVREGDTDWYTGQVKKTPGERVLHRGGRNEYTRVYDWSEAMKMALKDGWGLCAEKRPANWDTLTKGQKAELAVQSDFDFLQGWCDDSWRYVGVIVTLMVEDEDGDLVEYSGPLSGTFHDSLWGVEDNDSSYVESVAVELAEGIASAYLAEQAEAQSWAERDVVTV